MSRDSRVALPDVWRSGEYRSHSSHLSIGQSMDALQLRQQGFILLLQRLRTDPGRPANDHGNDDRNAKNYVPIFPPVNKCHQSRSPIKTESHP